MQIYNIYSKRKNKLQNEFFRFQIDVFFGGANI